MLVGLSTDYPEGKDCLKSNCWVVPLDSQGQGKSTTINRSNNNYCSNTLFDLFYLWANHEAAFTAAASKVPQMDSGGKCCKFWSLNGLNRPEIDWVMALWSFLLRGHFLFHICHCAHLFSSCSLYMIPSSHQRLFSHGVPSSAVSPSLISQGFCAFLIFSSRLKMWSKLFCQSTRPHHSNTLSLVFS